MVAHVDIDVVTEALKKDARMWEEQSVTLGEIHHTVEGLRLTHLEAGLFQVIFNAYGRAIDHLSKISLEGKHRMDEIADALYKNAHAYEDREEQVTQTVEGAY